MRTAAITTLAAIVALGGCGSSSQTKRTTGARTRHPTSKLSLQTTPKFAPASPATPVRSGRVRITYRLFGVSPEVVRVKAPATIEWVNEDPGAETAESRGASPEPFASPRLPPGGRYTLRLTKPGVYHFLSRLHAASINGTIEVLR